MNSVGDAPLLHNPGLALCRKLSLSCREWHFWLGFCPGPAPTAPAPNTNALLIHPAQGHTRQRQGSNLSFRAHQMEAWGAGVRCEGTVVPPETHTPWDAAPREADPVSPVFCVFHKRHNLFNDEVLVNLH